MSQSSDIPAPPAVPVSQLLRQQWSWSGVRERIVYLSLLACAMVSVATTAGIIFVLLNNSVFSIAGSSGRSDSKTPSTVSTAAPDASTADDSQFDDDKAFFQIVSVREFLTGTEWTPQYSEKHFGVLPLLCGTFLVAGIAALIGLPIGLLSAIYLSEYASPRARSIIKPTLELLAGIPTVVYGYFALVFVTPYVMKPVLQDLLGLDVGVFNAASAGIVVGIMIIPMVSSLSEDVLRAVPKSLREAAYALGSTKFDVSALVVVPAALSGIVASFLLAVSRAVGETMAVAMAAGMTPRVTLNPLKSIESMTAYIVNVSTGDAAIGSIEYKSIYAVGLTLFLITLMMNILSQIVLRRFREVYQ